MSKILVVAEKPDVARDIAKILKCRDAKNGYIEGERYICSWCLGHLVTLAEPEDYDKNLKKWQMETLPIIPKNMKLKVISDKYQQFNLLKGLMNREDVESIIEATDAGREGELIFRYVYNISSCSKPFKRLWISSLTPQAITDGFNNLKDSKEYDNLYFSAKCRSEADWLVGMNASRAFSIKCGATLSIGRVQTPTLAMIVKRKKEIDEFIPKDYYEVTACYSNFKGLWQDLKEKDSKIYDKNKAEEIRNKVDGKEGTVVDVIKELKNDYQPLLYDLTELQRDCSKRFGFSSKKTLEIAQNLYERYKYITYPRTDSRHLSNDIVPTLKQRLSNYNIEPYEKFITPIINEDLNITKRIVDNSKVSDHHAIIPTELKPNIERLSSDEKKVFDLIIKRFIAVFYPPCKYEVTSIMVEIEGETFISKGKVILQKGWTEIYGREKKKSEDKEEQNLPKVNKGDKVQVIESLVAAKQTNPPKPFTEHALLSAMENCTRYMEEGDLKEDMKEMGLSLGTPATRAEIIEKLIYIGYIERKKEKNITYLYPTEKGVKLIEFVPKELKSPELTGKWEKCLDKISKGEMQSKAYMDSIIRYIIFLIEESKKLKNMGIKEQNTSVKVKSVGTCPGCGGKILEYTKGFGCADYKSGCKFFLSKEDKMLLNFKKKLTSTLIRSLLKDGRVEIKGLVSPKSGNKFDSVIYVEKNEQGYWSLKLDFSANKFPEEVIGNCPEEGCDGKIIDTPKAYSCNKCSFVFFKENNFTKNFGKKLTKTFMKELLEKGTVFVEDMVSKNKGTKFNANVKLVKNDKYWNLTFDFDKN